MNSANYIRTCEWSEVDATITAGTRAAIESVAESWRQTAGVNFPPLSFSGANGATLKTRQFVGIVEVEDTTIEIFPKLDSALLETDEALDTEKCSGSVMRNLLWLLEVGGHQELIEAGQGHLDEVPTSFLDLFAYLLGRNLLLELQRGVLHQYVSEHGDLKSVRGRINLGTQLTKNWNRLDKISCRWDEFTPNNEVNRLLKCACAFLAPRISFTAASQLLRECLGMLADVEDVTPQAAISGLQRVPFQRSFERFRLAFDLAKRLLSGISHDFGIGSEKTFVFLLDMNRVFEDYVHAVLSCYFSTTIKRQFDVGRLLVINKAGMAQYADYYWRTEQDAWIGDAKYKHLAQGCPGPLAFMKNDAEKVPVAGEVLDVADIRQLTVYAELHARKSGDRPNLMLLYPYLGPLEFCVPQVAQAWNGSWLWLMPVQVRRCDFAADAIRLPELVHSEDAFE